MDIKTVIIKAIGSKFNTKGDSFRIKHEFKMDGSICTEDHKDPALTVTRDTGGWGWHCHRCSESGYIGDMFIDSATTLKKIDQIKDPPIPKVTYIVKLPDDFIPLVNENLVHSEPVPFEAYSWLWKYNITEKDMHEFGFGWSTKCQMVILPLYSSDNRVLRGWIGRRIFASDVLSEKGKYHVQKPKGNKDRLYFTVDGSEGKTILVEDCISAIRVNKSTGVTTTALLTTSIDESMTRKLRGEEVYIWLDANVLAKSVAMVARFRQLGINAKHIYTAKDPKCYNSVAIKEIWKESIKEK